MGSIDKDILLFFVFVDPRGTYHQFRARLSETGNPFVQCHLGISTAHQRLVPLPIAALLTRQCLHRDALHGFHHQTAAQQRIVDTQRTFLVGTKNKS